MQKLPIFAEAMNRNMTGLFFKFLDYKVEHKENISIEWKGVTRSGKSTGAISTHKYIAMRTGVPFLPKYVCQNEQYYIDAIKVAVDNQGLVVDEQLETHVGIGSFREMQYTEDLNNIIAKRCLVGDTKIFLADGTLKKIQDIAGNRQKVMSFDFKMEKLEPKKAIAYSTGYDDVYEITTEHGKVFHATLDHEMFIEVNGTVKKIAVKDLKEGDMLATIKL
jgi:hypothetical protein